MVPVPLGLTSQQVGQWYCSILCIPAFRIVNAPLSLALQPVATKLLVMLSSYAVLIIGYTVASHAALFCVCGPHLVLCLQYAGIGSNGWESGYVGQ